MSLDIVIRADASAVIGSGHVVRCLALARAARRAGARVRFVCRTGTDGLSARIAASGFDVDPIEKGVASEQEDAGATAAAIGRNAPDWLVVDHYELGATWEHRLRGSARRILAIDDIARSHDCDAVLDANRVGDTRVYEGLVPPQAQHLTGPRYALLAPEYAALRHITPARSGRPRRVLVSFGGADATDETSRALDALATTEFSHLAVDVVIGPLHTEPGRIAARAARRPDTTVHVAPRSLAGLMVRADVAIGAAGSTTWERLCLRLPSIVVTAARNQESAARALDASGHVRWLGNAGAVSATDYAQALRVPLPPLESLPELVDGYGARRCVRMMLRTGGGP